jgi:hypothetical protein
MPAPDGKVDSPSPVAIATAPARCFISISLVLPDLPIYDGYPGVLELNLRMISAAAHPGRRTLVELDDVGAGAQKSLKDLKPKDF